MGAASGTTERERASRQNTDAFPLACKGMKEEVKRRRLYCRRERLREKNGAEE